ncbi:LacI family DNA-binding transcriptional regulator [Compostimonas suwonensis]|uniref:LacI family transcriptional regulator n=1 Tax=Compostimonas suwonensis TaxID=1048394 RepID=A0A2M9BV94_9MICO|nr:LacI family DNA-binding transcriptional regulator [Compostimonas suwonensis]PJJ61873.1 LacI family transcriptional regulator [Compostimonas suwonensis]
MTAKRPTMRSVAEVVGVSHQTVARVLNGDTTVVESTRQRVLAAAAEQNYVLTTATRSTQARSTSKIIGVIAPYGADALFNDPHLLGVVHGATRAIAARGHKMLLSLPATEHDRTNVFADALAERITDAMIVEAGVGEEGFADIVKAGYPMIVIGYTTHEVASVRGDDEGGMYALTQHLLALGHRRIAVIDGPEEDRLVLASRRAGIQRAMKDAAIGEIVVVERGDFGTESGEAAAARLMSAEQHPTAIMAMNDRMAIGAMNWLQHNGYSVPGDISVTGFDDIPAAALVSPALTSVHVSSPDLGEKAAEILLDSGLRPTAGTTVLPVRLVVRDSTSPARRG